jgi:NifU-like protein involved in Fe-S cluster formation
MEETNQNTVEVLKNIGYSEKAILLLFLQLNFGTIENPDITARHQSGCSDTLILYLKLDREIIVNAKYEYIGCTGLQVAASALTEIIRGMSLSEASKVSFQDILNYLESIPQLKYECINLALNTLREGINKFQ